MNGAETCEDPFLMVAGVIKSGTTSLHKYLADHPGICGSDPKDPGYFLPPEAPGGGGIRHGRDPLGRYLQIFSDHRPGQVRMESSPTYLSRVGTEHAIKGALPDTRLVFSLRDPIDRLISYYQMAVLWRWLPAGMSFDDFVDECRGGEQTSPHFRYPLGDGRYTEDLRRYRGVFGADRILVVWFDELRRTPREVLQEIARFAAIDPRFFDDYEFTNVNPARQPRSEAFVDRYQSLAEYVRGKLGEGTPARRAVGALHNAAKWRVLYKLFTHRTPAPQPSSATAAFLRDFYGDDVITLTDLLGCAPPWAERYVGQNG